MFSRLHLCYELRKQNVLFSLQIVSDSLEKTMMLGKIEGRRRRGRQRHGITMA